MLSGVSAAALERSRYALWGKCSSKGPDMLSGASVQQQRSRYAVWGKCSSKGPDMLSGTSAAAKVQICCLGQVQQQRSRYALWSKCSSKGPDMLSGPPMSETYTINIVMFYCWVSSTSTIAQRICGPNLVPSYLPRTLWNIPAIGY